MRRVVVDYLLFCSEMVQKIKKGEAILMGEVEIVLLCGKNKEN